MNTENKSQFHNPNFKIGDWVVAQKLEDEEKGFPLGTCNTGIYQVKGVAGSFIILRSQKIDSLELDLEGFIRTGVKREERFTVIKDPNTLKNPDAPDFTFE